MSQSTSDPLMPKLLRAALVVLVVLTCLRVWTQPAQFLPEAQAQIPDAGTQRLRMLDEVRETNRLLAEILSTLREGALNVRQAGTDKNQGRVIGPRAPVPDR